MRNSFRGMTFIDVVVGTGIMLVVFLSIFASYNLAILLVLNTKARVGGMSLASQQLEYMRGLPYNSLGTVGGIPFGAIQQTATSTLNNISYTLRTLIKYVDDPADGLDNADTNGITADYKLVKVEVVWSLRDRAHATFVVTNIAPQGIESLADGGTLRVNVFDATASPVSDASVRIRNASSTPAIDITVDTDVLGTIAFPGAPAASGYMISVTKDGYSSAQTYDVSVGNPNPNPGAVTVVLKKTTTASFAIDRLGSLSVSTYSPVAVGLFQDTFAGQTQLSATTSTIVSGGVLHLDTDINGDYQLAGEAYSVPITPAKLVSWDQMTWNASTGVDTTLGVQLYYLLGGSYVLVPNGVIAGNSAGLTSGSVSLSALATSTYPSLQLKAVLATSNASTTPTITDWKIDYHAGPTLLPNISFNVRGTKTIGTDAGGVPIYKYNRTNTTASDGVWTILPLEWDSYTIAITGSSNTISEQCPNALSVAPGQNQSVALTLVPRTEHSLRVAVSGAGAPLPGATVSIVGATNATGITSSCGQTMFSSLESGTYTVQVSATGYQTNTQNIPVLDTTVLPVPLSP